MRRKYPLLIRLWSLRERHPQRGPGRSTGRKRFYYNLISADRLCWQQLAANSIPFRPEKWDTVYISVQNVGITVNYAYGVRTHAVLLMAVSPPSECEWSAIVVLNEVSLWSLTILWHWTLTFQSPNHVTSSMSQGHSIHQVWTLCSLGFQIVQTSFQNVQRFVFESCCRVRTNRQTDRQTNKQTDGLERSTHADRHSRRW